MHSTQFPNRWAQSKVSYARNVRGSLKLSAHRMAGMDRTRRQFAQNDCPSSQGSRRKYKYNINQRVRRTHLPKSGGSAQCIDTIRPWKAAYGIDGNAPRATGGGKRKGFSATSGKGAGPIALRTDRDDYCDPVADQMDAKIDRRNLAATAGGHEGSCGVCWGRSAGQLSGRPQLRSALRGLRRTLGAAPGS